MRTFIIDFDPDSVELLDDLVGTGKRMTADEAADLLGHDVYGTHAMVYEGGLYIEVEDNGEYSMIIGRTVMHSRDLAELERVLAGWAVTEGWEFKKYRLRGDDHQRVYRHCHKED